MIQETLAKRLLLPLHMRRTNDRTLERLAVLEKSQYRELEAIRLRQLEALRRLLKHCYLNVPFYRRRFDAARFHPDSFREFEDLRRIPHLSKEDLQQNLPELVAGNYDRSRLILDSSGGSTGKPTLFYKDLRRYLDGKADQYRHDSWCGWRLGEKCVKLWGAQREFDEQPSLKSRLLEKYVHRVYGFNAFDISEEKVVEYLASLTRIRPTMILAYANVAYLFAGIIQKHGIDLHHLRLKGVICSAETLTDGKRAAIEAAFCCKVLNRYGSREVGLIASECLEQKGLHLNADSLFVEIEQGGRAARPGEWGEIIVTDLWNYGMPFIRYQMGDVGTMSAESCSCGRNLPMLAKVEGRVSDFLMDARGNLVHGEYFTHLFYGVSGVKQFQLVQETLDQLTLRIAPDDRFAPSILEPIIQKIKECLGSGVKVTVDIAASSLVESSGKFRFTISRVAPGYFRSC